MNTPIEAYFLLMDKIDNLTVEGFDISKASACNDELPERDNGIPRKLWESFCIKSENNIQLEKIQETLLYLNLCGIQFDIGGVPNSGIIDLNIDWSFTFIKGNECEYWRLGVIELIRYLKLDN